jgi:hypothetical protein
MERFDKRFQPVGIDLTLDFDKELNAVSKSREPDPNIMIDELEALSARYRSLKMPFFAGALVIHLASALTAEKRIMELSGETLTLDDL